MGVVSLCRKHSAAAVDDACAAALEFGAPEYRFVKHYIDRVGRAQLSLKQVDPLIRELTQYRDLIELRTQKENETDEHQRD